MTVKILICFQCKHYLGRKICRAFTSGIPLVILQNKNLHSKPLPNQDNDIVFEKINA